MGKNKAKDIWDLTPEEQLKGADKFYEFEKGTVGIMDISKVTKQLNENGLTGDVEAKIISDFSRNKKNNKPVVDNATEDQVSSLLTDVMNSIINEENTNSNNYSKFIGVDGVIRFDVNDELGKYIVEDGIAPTVLSLPVVFAEDVYGTFDSDDIYEYVDIMKLYTISLKHPTAIFDVDDFFSNEGFDKIKSYNKDKFMFFIHENDVFCYIIDTDSKTTFEDSINDIVNKTDDIISYLKFYVALSYACGTMNQAFFVEDSLFVERLYNSSYNHKSLFVEVFKNDVNTSFIPDDRNLNDDEGIECLDIKEVQTTARMLINNLKGSSIMFEDEDGLDDDDIDFSNVDEDETSSTDIKEIKTTTESVTVEKTTTEVTPIHEINTDNASALEISQAISADIEKDLLSPEMEEVNVSKEKDDSLVVDVITKRGNNQ